MRTTAIIQARMGSSRLPGKVLMEIDGKPMLTRVVSRVLRAEKIDDVVVATTTESQDDPVWEFCQQVGYQCFRGDHLDVLDRYYQAAKHYECESIVRVTADCPLIDPGVLDLVVGTFHDRFPQVDYVSNVLTTRHFPRGLDCEVFTFEALRRAWRVSTAPLFREHVTAYFYHHPEEFRLHGVHHETDQSHHRWTVDTGDDIYLIREIYATMGTDDFTWLDVLEAAEHHPEWAEINGHIQQKAA